jgi:mannitol/fructose-specific phosphotransferase system IIA component (Ntr-type)
MRGCVDGLVKNGVADSFGAVNLRVSSLPSRDIMARGDDDLDWSERSMGPRDYVVCTAVFGGNRYEVLLEILLARLATSGHIPAHAVPTILGAMRGRERLASTQTGGGVAFPNGQHRAVPRSLCALAVCEQPLGFRSPDGEVVDIVVLCLSPADLSQDHLVQSVQEWKTLLWFLRNPELRHRLRQATTAEEVAALVWAEDGILPLRDWLTCTDPIAMIGRLINAGRAAERKARLFSCACCRRLWDLLRDEPDRRAVGVAERFADGLASAAELRLVREALEDLGWVREGHVGLLWVAGWYADPYGGAQANAGDPDSPAVLALATVLERAEAILDLCLPWATALGLPPMAQAELLREVFPAPDSTGLVQPGWLAWNGGCVARLARGIREDQAFDRLPILGDALLDAGCDNEQVLAHCRAGRTHVRGCWLLDLLTDEE